MSGRGRRKQTVADGHIKKYYTYHDGGYTNAIITQYSSVVPWDTFPFDVVYCQAVSEGELVIVMSSPTVGATQALPSTETMQSLTAPVITEKVHDVVAEMEHVADAITEMESDETSIDVDTGPLFSDDDEPQNDDVDNEWMDEVQDADMCSKCIQTILHKLQELDALCGVYIVYYIAHPESITLKQGKTNYFITTNMLEILGDRFIRKLHGKIFAYAQSDLYNTHKALNVNIKVQQVRAMQVKAKEAQARVEKEKVAAEERKLAVEKEKAEAERERAVAEAG
ncbi:hypothetical protein C8Q75DRAFT_734629 [Abortiporus biennis]|nr:hypothetical protein C8Q75DRAFT_734629 [Abortiporus biennis]